MLLVQIILIRAMKFDWSWNRLLEYNAAHKIANRRDYIHTRINQGYCGKQVETRTIVRPSSKQVGKQRHCSWYEIDKHRHLSDALKYARKIACRFWILKLIFFPRAVVLVLAAPVACFVVRGDRLDCHHVIQPAERYINMSSCNKTNWQADVQVHKRPDCLCVLR